MPSSTPACQHRAHCMSMQKKRRFRVACGEPLREQSYVLAQVLKRHLFQGAVCSPNAAVVVAQDLRCFSQRGSAPSAPRECRFCAL